MAERLTIEHYVGECTLKCAQVILAARIPRKSSAVPPVDKRSGRWVSAWWCGVVVPVLWTKRDGRACARVHTAFVRRVAHSSSLRSETARAYLTKANNRYLDWPRNTAAHTLRIHATQFLLEVDEVAGLAKQLEAWRRDIYQPLVIEVRVCDSEQALEASAAEASSS
jgi:hypothetical protein